MTKVTILGETQGAEPEKKKIEFVKMYKFDELVKFNSSDTKSPNEWAFIELVCRDFEYRGLDLMFCHDGSRSYSALYLGHFNDGIV